MGWRENQDAMIAAGIGPEDAPEPVDRGPEILVVSYVKPELCTDGEMHECRTYREFPAFAAKAAFRWLDYWQRKLGKGNAWIEFY